LPEHQHHPPPLGLRTYFNISCGLLVALYFLMVGYVSKDAPRRAMSARFWIAICLVMPGGIGAVLYFLLRQPEVTRCPSCSTHVQGDFHFCPQCNYQLTASCGHCFRTVRVSDQYCTRCGHELAADHMPARLRALGGKPREFRMVGSLLQGFIAAIVLGLLTQDCALLVLGYYPFPPPGE
jgi:hypothetical protein